MSEAVQTPAVSAPAVVPPAPAVAAPTVVPPTVQPATPGDPAKAIEVPKGAPEKYEAFKAPEGMQAQPALVESFSTVAKKLGLSQEAAQELVTFQMESIRQELTAYDKRITEEKASIPMLMAKDPVLGGANAVANLATMQRAITAFGSPELTAFLDAKETGPDIYLHFARFAYKVGAAIKEDSVAGTQGGNGEAADTSFEGMAKSFYAKAPVVQTK